MQKVTKSKGSIPPTISTSNSPDGKKKQKLVIQTPKHKHTSSLITPKSSSFKFKPLSTISSKPKLSLSKFTTPSTTKMHSSSNHKHAFSETVPSTVKNSKIIKRKVNNTPEKKSLFKSIKLPITPETTIALFLSSLNAFEETEIMSFQEIYYIGYGINKVKTILMNNFGFDDEKGDYKIIIGDHIAYRYEIKCILGKGSFGQVVKVFDHKDNKELALKIIKNRPRFHQQALEEVEILRYLKDKDPNDTYCVVQIQENFLFRKHMVNSI